MVEAAKNTIAFATVSGFNARCIKLDTPVGRTSSFPVAELAMSYFTFAIAFNSFATTWVGSFA
jgi:hypothetical protein